MGAHTYLREKHFTDHHEEKHAHPHITLASSVQWHPQPPKQALWIQLGKCCMAAMLWLGVGRLSSGCPGPGHASPTESSHALSVVIHTLLIETLYPPDLGRQAQDQGAPHAASYLAGPLSVQTKPPQMEASLVDVSGDILLYLQKAGL